MARLRAGKKKSIHHITAHIRFGLFQSPHPHPFGASHMRKRYFSFLFMLFILNIVVAIILGILSSIAGRLQATGLWAGKAMIPPEASSSQPRGLQDALTNGWPSTFSFIVSISILTTIIISIFYAWWGPILILFVILFTKSIAERTNVCPKNIDWYLLKLRDHALNRQANYARDKDTMRAEASKNLVSLLDILLQLYQNSKIPAPTMKIAKQAPYGEHTYLLKYDHKAEYSQTRNL